LEEAWKEIMSDLAPMPHGSYSFVSAVKGRKQENGKMKYKSFVLIACLCLFISSTHAFVFWDGSGGGVMKDGMGTGFSWTDGGSENGYFGTPTLVGGDTFIFTPSAFKAEKTGTGIDSISDTLIVDLMANMGNIITGVKIYEYGDYGITNDGEVDAYGSVIMHRLDAVELDASDTLVTNPIFPFDSEGTSTGTQLWNGVMEITDLDWTKATVTVNNHLVAIAYDDFSYAFIQKKGVQSQIAIEIIPEPATLVLLGLGGLLLRKRRV
jgi:hypothetical protein